MTAVTATYPDRPLLLDLFSGAGGAGVGYHQAGFEVVGVDINPQPRYPFGFHQGDALEVLDWLLWGGTAGGYSLEDFAAVHASPPCQGYSRAMKHLTTKEYPQLVEPVRERLQATGIPYVIENVVGAPLLDPVMLCGTMFGRRLWRHRLFESPVTIEPRECCHDSRVTINPYYQGACLKLQEEFGRDCNISELFRKEMGVEWMNRKESKEAIPPAYTEYIGGQVLAALKLPADTGA